MEPVAAVSALDASSPVPEVASIGVSTFEPVVPPAMAHAQACTGFDRYPCILDPAAASIAAAAAAQDLRTFQLSQVRLRRAAGTS